MKSIYRLVPVLALFFLPGAIAPGETALPTMHEASTLPIVNSPQFPLVTQVFGPRSSHYIYFNSTYFYERISAPVPGAPYPSSFSRSYTAWGVGNVDILVQPQYLCEGFKMNLNVQVGNNSYFISGISPGSPFPLQYPHFNSQVSVGGWIYASQWPAPAGCSNGENRVSVTIS